MAQAQDQAGRVAVVTGSNTGIGLEIARALAARHTTVVLACRNLDRANAAREDILASAPGSDVAVVQLDTSSLASVAACAQLMRQRWPVIDLLINNAGVMAREHAYTVDGFETDFSTNFLGHFALTGGLIDALTAAPAGRIITVSSITHRRRNAGLDFDDLTLDRGFDPAVAYARSKMASMTFMIELQRRLSAVGASTLSLAAHPGGVRTSILQQQNRLIQLVYHPRLTGLTGWFTQSPAAGAQPILRAALDTDARGADFFGPGGRWELIGRPVPVAISRRAQDPALATRLWAAAEELTGVRFLQQPPITDPVTPAEPDRKGL
ncbi:oxidoreductase [Nocardia sp. NPDC058633]|uniref:oxidoreductase n=1 Tax=Nocardia sp. NPDC058633 TaxID=3346568 RepID=UPI0036479838